MEIVIRRPSMTPTIDSQAVIRWGFIMNDSPVPTSVMSRKGNDR